MSQSSQLLYTMHTCHTTCQTSLGGFIKAITSFSIKQFSLPLARKKQGNSEPINMVGLENGNYQRTREICVRHEPTGRGH